MATSRSRGRARNGSGTVTPRRTADGTVVYDAMTPKVYDPDKGAERRIPKRGHATEAAAQAWITRTVADAANGQKFIERRGGATVDMVMERWKGSSHLKATTLERYAYNYGNTISPLIGNEPIGKLRSTDLDALFATLAKKHTPSMMVAIIRPLTAIWDFAVRDGKATANIVEESPWPKKFAREAAARRAEKVAEREDVENGLIRVFTPEQFRTLQVQERHQRYRVLYSFIVMTGARIGEVCGLRWSEIDFEKGVIWFGDNYQKVASKYILVDTPKGNRRRKIYVDTEVLELLREQRRSVDEIRAKHGGAWVDRDLVFPRLASFARAPEPMGGHQSPETISNRFSKLCKDANLPHITLHGLRHTWASMAYAAGVDLKTIQDHLGHRVDVTTLIYVHVDTATKREAVVRVVDALRAT